MQCLQALYEKCVLQLETGYLLLGLILSLIKYYSMKLFDRKKPQETEIVNEKEVSYSLEDFILIETKKLFSQLAITHVINTNQFESYYSKCMEIVIFTHKKQNDENLRNQIRETLQPENSTIDTQSE